jgi:hypothetical protein
VLTYPLHVASVYRFCSSVPEFAVSIPSVYASRQTTFRLANRLHQLACKGLTPSGIIRHLSIPCPCWAHTKCFCNGAVTSWFKVLSSFNVFVSWDRTRLRKGTTAETQTLTLSLKSPPANSTFGFTRHINQTLTKPKAPFFAPDSYRDTDKNDNFTNG